MRADAHSIEQYVEILYAFDIHCNGMFPLVMLTSVLQYIFLPFLLSEGLVARVAGNTLYLIGLSAYTYITFLGYKSLPFLQVPKTLLIYPIVTMVIITALVTFAGGSITQYMLSFTLGED